MTLYEYVIQLFYTFLCNSKNYQPEVLCITQCSVAQGNSASYHSSHRRDDLCDCSPEKYLIVNG